MRWTRRAEALISELRGVPAPARHGYDRGTKELAPLVDGLLKRFQIAEERVEEKIAANWRWLVGEHYAGRCAPQRISADGRTLLVFAATAVLCQELLFEKRPILKRLHQIPGCERLRELVIRTG
ncbi:MAG: DUF721 domain-containing protein [Opitutales bacterium]